ncbi:MAG: MotA/TolQ/ExbB proton channel family protein [Lentisphaeria bacterium]
MFETIKYAFYQSDGMGKAIVLLLLFLSLYAWYLMIQKISSVWQLRSGTRKFLDEFEEQDSPLAMARQLTRFHGPLKDICQAGMEELVNILQLDESGQRQLFHHCLLPRQLDLAEVEKIRSGMNRILTRHSLKMEDRLIFLGSIVSLSPFLGLFGTVWGVMATFIGIAKVGRPDLMAIAPGVSGALLTTVAGLVVAIPALVGNNYIVNCVQETSIEMDAFVDEFIASLRLEVTVSAIPPAANEQEK